MNSNVEPELEESQPHWINRAAFNLVSLLFFSSQAALATAVYHGWYWLAVPLALVVSHFMHGYLIAFHEASHGMLRKNRRLNDLDGTLIGSFSMMSFTLYRALHQTHHAHLASPRDLELWPFVRTEIPRWKRCLAAFLELNFGFFYSPFIFLRAFLSKDSPVRSPKVRRRIWAELGLSVLVWTVMLWSSAHFGAWKYFFWVYFAPAFLAANLQSWRKYIEHVGMTGSTVNSSTRSIVSNTWMGQLVSLTLLHEPYHGVHHRRAGLPHAELPFRVADLAPMAAGEREPFPNYRAAFFDLIRSLADPRVGAQWRGLTSEASTLEVSSMSGSMPAQK